MSHLLAISVGPIQEFIAAARRTRDLWFGSFLLSEISRAVAQSVAANGGKLVFPESPDAENVANVIVAEVPTGDPQTLVAKAKEAANRRWQEFVKDTLDQVRDVIHRDIWEDQKDDVLEFYAAWVPYKRETYRFDRTALMRLLAGRKTCRNFVPTKGRTGVPKSSLDGQRESVFKPRSEWPPRFRARLRVGDGEQLDVVGLVKRLAEGRRPYPSVSRIAADPWVRGNKNKSAFNNLKAACEQLSDSVLQRLNTEVFSQFRDFPYEGTAVYVNRHHEWKQETEDQLDLRDIQRALSSLPEPSPYLAVLVADGDKMGETISRLPDADANRQFSRTLAGFAGEARKIVAAHHGVLVYAGGDDVLAFVPVDTCLSCARQLHDEFGSRLKQYGTPTLSVGIAIAHFIENLEDLLDYGRDAEKAAKQPDRNGLAIHLHKRGGSPVCVRSSWTKNPDTKLFDYAKLLQSEAIPNKLPYELLRLADVYTTWPKDTQTALQADVLRVIRDKQPKAGRSQMGKIEEIVKAELTDTSSLKHFAEQLLVARQIAVALQQVGESSRKARVQEVAS